MSTTAEPKPATGEQIHKVWRAAMLNSDGKPEGTRESLAMCAGMIEVYAPQLWPASDNGQVDFARAMVESVADEIRAFLGLPKFPVPLQAETFVTQAKDPLPAEQPRSEGGGA